MSNVLDLRQLNKADRHPMLFQMLKGLEEDESLTVLSNYDLKAVYPQLEKRGFSYDSRNEDFKWLITIQKKTQQSGSAT